MSKYEIVLGIILGVFFLVYLFLGGVGELVIIDKLKTSFSMFVFGIGFVISCLADFWFDDIANSIILTFFDITKHFFAICILLLCIMTFLAAGWKDD